VQGIAKLDLLAPKTQKECAVATIEYADGARGGEAFFVPRSQDPSQLKGEQQLPRLLLLTLHQLNGVAGPCLVLWL
jgi:hypothetical protein